MILPVLLAAGGGRKKVLYQSYVHGYDPNEARRLQDQASTLVELLHADTMYPAGHTVLEAGCGVGAQTLTLARQSPQTQFISLDVSSASVAAARRAVQDAGLANVQVMEADIMQLPFVAATFDHVFVCFVLEHLAKPVSALKALKQVLKTGGTITVIEGDHGSAYFYPESEWARRAIQCQVELQARAGGNAMIGRALYPLLRQADFCEVHVSPRLVYADASRPALVEGFTRKTFTAMIAGVREAAIGQGLATPEAFDRGLADLLRTTAADGVFCYTFFKAMGVKPPGA